MKQSVRLVMGLLVLGTLSAGALLVWWPAAVTEAAFGARLAPEAGLAIQWRATLPFDVGLAATVITALMVLVGLLALTESERRRATLA